VVLWGHSLAAVCCSHVRTLVFVLNADLLDYVAGAKFRAGRPLPFRIASDDANF
jgi:hypothetical protein